MQIRKIIAAFARGFADALDPPLPALPPMLQPAPPLLVAPLDPVALMVAEMQLRAALHAALHRYLPAEKPGEA